MMLNEKLVRLLARLVMRETLKTSTLTSMVITSLALDTDARGRQQHKHKSLSPPPLGRGRRCGNQTAIRADEPIPSSTCLNQENPLYSPFLDAPCLLLAVDRDMSPGAREQSS